MGIPGFVQETLVHYTNSGSDQKNTIDNFAAGKINMYSQESQENGTV